MYYLVLFSSLPVRYIGPSTLDVLQTINNSLLNGNGHIFKHMSCMKRNLSASNIVSPDKFLEERREQINRCKEGFLRIAAASGLVR